MPGTFSPVYISLKEGMRVFPFLYEGEKTKKKKKKTLLTGTFPIFCKELCYAAGSVFSVRPDIIFLLQNKKMTGNIIGRLVSQIELNFEINEA